MDVNQDSAASNNHKDQEETVHFGYRTVRVDEKVKLVQNHFDSIAARYDLINTVLSFGLHHLWKKSAVKMLELNPGAQVIDVCGGTADLAIIAARAVGPSGSVTVYDINQAMMELGRRKVRNVALEDRIRFVQGDAEQICLTNAQFDAAMVGFGIRNMTRMENGLAEMHRVLKPGGKFLCLEFSQPAPGAFRRLYDFYSFQAMPRIGRFFAGSGQAYHYLPESIRLFPSPEALSTIIEQAGFSNVTHRLLSKGIAAIHVGVKL
jgi:demethylmenaquinone methyltransferase/2-methoxy-6-polyprenyl-1,4-benzoquinol methylase